MKEEKKFLCVRDLEVIYTSGKKTVQAVNRVSFDLQKGETLALVGETGAGKTTIAKAILGILPNPPAKLLGGEVWLDGEELIGMSEEKKLKIKGEKMQIVFQDPYSSLNPRIRIESTIMEPLKHSGRYKTKAELKEQTHKLMELVGVDERLRQSYPHELDGGRRQRVGIARALALEPDFIVCDEPVSALDVSIQAQVLNLLMDLQEKMGVAYLFVTHDLSVVRHISNSVCVMYLGQLVEKASTNDLFLHTLHYFAGRCGAL